MLEGTSQQYEYRENTARQFNAVQSTAKQNHNTKKYNRKTKGKARANWITFCTCLTVACCFQTLPLQRTLFSCNPGLGARTISRWIMGNTSSWDDEDQCRTTLLLELRLFVVGWHDHEMCDVGNAPWLASGQPISVLSLQYISELAKLMTQEVPRQVFPLAFLGGCKALFGTRRCLLVVFWSGFQGKAGFRVAQSRRLAAGCRRNPILVFEWRVTAFRPKFPSRSPKSSRLAKVLGTTLGHISMRGYVIHIRLCHISYILKCRRNTASQDCGTGHDFPGYQRCDASHIHRSVLLMLVVHLLLHELSWRCVPVRYL